MAFAFQAIFRATNLKGRKPELWWNLRKLEEDDLEMIIKVEIVELNYTLGHEYERHAPYI